MGANNIIRQEVTKVRLNSHLAESCEPGIDVGERIFKHFAMLGVLGCFQLMEDPLPGEKHQIVLALPGELIRSKLRPGFIHCGESFGLLILNRLAFPPSRHD